MSKLSKLSKLTLVFLAVTGVVVGACNTFRGAGRDVSAAGRGIENAADEVQEDLEDEDDDN